MASNYTETQIANWALQLCGASRITDISDETNEADVANTFLPIARDSIISAYPWQELIRRAQLAADAESPSWGYANQYTLPSDCMRLIGRIFSGDSIRLANDAWILEGNKILTNAEGPINIRYVSKHKAVGSLSEQLVGLIAHYLAVLICDKLNQDVSRRSQLRKMFDEYSRATRTADSRQNPHAKLFMEDSWDDARFLNGGAASYDGRQGGSYS